MNRITMILACTAVLLCGCAKQSLENIYSNQEAKIDRFISGIIDSNPEYSVVHNNGSNRVIMSQGTGPALKEGGRISFYYAGYTFNGNLNASNIFATNNQAFAEENGWSVSDPDYEVKTAVLAEGELLEGLLYGLEGVREGEVCLILFSGKYGYGKKHIGTIPANSALAFQIWVERVSE